MKNKLHVSEDCAPLKVISQSHQKASICSQILKSADLHADHVMDDLHHPLASHPLHQSALQSANQHRHLLSSAVAQQLSFLLGSQSCLFYHCPID